MKRVSLETSLLNGYINNAGLAAAKRVYKSCFITKICR